MSPRRPITARQLRALLLHFPADSPVILADAEGNRYSPAIEYEAGMYADQSGATGKLYPTPEAIRDDPTLTRGTGPIPEGAVKAITLYPMR